MTRPVIVGLRNVYRTDEMKRAHFQYFGVGRSDQLKRSTAIMSWALSRTSPAAITEGFGWRAESSGISWMGEIIRIAKSVSMRFAESLRLNRLFLLKEIQHSAHMPNVRREFIDPLLRGH